MQPSRGQAQSVVIVGLEATALDTAGLATIVQSLSAGTQVLMLDATQLATILASMAAQPTGVPAAAADVHEPASNTAAVVTYAAAAGLSHVISGIGFGYDIDPTGGTLQVTVGGTVVFRVPVTKSGAGFIPFTPPKRGTAGAEVVVTLAAGGAGCTGKLSVLGHWTE